MVKLMTYAGTAEDPLATRTGGVPHTPDSYVWPRCRTCAGAMQFLAQIRLADAGATGDGLLSIFMCQNDPGLCDEWDPAEGGNAAAVFALDGLRPATPPDDGVTRLDEVSAVALEEVAPAESEKADAKDGEKADAGDDEKADAGDGEKADAGDYQAARDLWTRRTGRSPRDVLGQLGGRPDWIQDDETPACTDCGRPMTFVVQLEEGHDHRTAMNFGGGGCGYGFHCGPCGTAAFLWQS